MAKNELSDDEIKKLVYTYDPDIDSYYEGPSMSDIVAIVRSAIKTLKQAAPDEWAERLAFQADWEMVNRVPMNSRTHDDGSYGDFRIEAAWQSWKRIRSAVAAKQPDGTNR